LSKFDRSFLLWFLLFVCLFGQNSETEQWVEEERAFSSSIASFGHPQSERNSAAGVRDNSGIVYFLFLFLPQLPRVINRCY
jgi:hypothetical protein